MLARMILSLFMKGSPSIETLNRRLLRVSRRLDREAHASVLSESVGGRIIISLFGKGIRTFRAIELLKSGGFVEQAWELCRSLLEATVNVLYFLKNDRAEMSRRFVDCQFLENMKRAREANFFQGTPLESNFNRADMEKEYAEVCSRYSPEELARLKKNGFSGVPFDQRAKAVDLGHMYAYYRIASRNLHGFDAADAPAFLEVFQGGREIRRDLLKHRGLELGATQHELLARLCCIIHDLIGSKETARLGSILKDFRAYRASIWPVEVGERAPAGTQPDNLEQGD